MAITYPRVLPENEMRMQECWMDYSENVVNATSAKGLFINSTQIANPIWKLNVTTGLLTLEQRAIWSGWRKSLRGLKEFLVFDVRCAYPFYYRDARSPAAISSGWNGTATVTSLGASGVLGLSGLPASYKFGVGDRIGLEQNGSYGYYEVIEDVIASAGGAVSVSVMPFLHTRTFTTSAIARIWQAKAKFRLDWNSYDDSGAKEPIAISFKGVQLL